MGQRLQFFRAQAGDQLVHRRRGDQRKLLLDLPSRFAEIQAQATAVFGTAAAQQQPFFRQARQHARHRAAVHRQLATQFDRTVGAVETDEDQHLELGGGDVQRGEVLLEDAVLGRGTDADELANGALEGKVGGAVVTHGGGDRCLGRESVSK